MQWLTAKSTQGENSGDSSPVMAESHSSNRQAALATHHEAQPLHDATYVTQTIRPLQHGLDDDVHLSQKIQQLKYELEVCKQLGREAEGRRIEERKRLQANLDSKRQELTRTLQQAKTSISYFEYCRIIRQSFNAAEVATGEESPSLEQQHQDQQQQQNQKQSSASGPRHRSWYGWCEGFLLRGIHHAMMTKDQLDIVQRHCNSLLMEVYADSLPRLKKEKDLVEKTWTTAIIQMEQYLARRQHFQQRSFDLRRQIQKHYSGGHYENATVMVGPPVGSPRTPCMGTPSRGILKNATGKSTSRWEEDRTSNQRGGLSPPKRQQTSNSSWTEDDSDDDDEEDGAESQVPSLNVPSGSSSVPTLSSPPAFSLQPTRV